MALTLRRPGYMVGAARPSNIHGPSRVRLTCKSWQRTWRKTCSTTCRTPSAGWRAGETMACRAALVYS
eukprot:4465158-Lingulodinium_polyedra.AAC.1